MPSSALHKWLGIEIIETSPAEKIVATLAGALSIWLLTLLSSWALPGLGATAVVASMGASAVLLFGVPHGALSQPWPVIGGHGLSAFIGVTCSLLIPHPPLAAACAVGLAIGAMHQTKCVHPPGGATAFTAVMGGPAIHQLGYRFALFPVLTNALVLVLLAVLLNYAFKWRRYPAVLSRPALPPPIHVPGEPPLPTHEQVVTALRSLDSFVDITEEDLLRLVDLLNHPQSLPAAQPCPIPNAPPIQI